MQLAFVALAVAVVAVVLWLSSLAKAKALDARIASMLVENASLNETQKTLSEQQKKQSKVLEQRVEEVTELKKEIGGLKKKNFALQEDAKKNKTSYEAKLEEREKMLVARPAFESAEPVRAKPVPTPTPIKAEPSKSDEVKPHVSADAELTRKLDQLVKDNSELIATVSELKNELRNSQGEMRRTKKRIDDYRRADIVTKNRMDLLADKLGSMGRQYYDAISELAALKGEVKPPMPRDVAFAKEQADGVARDEAAAARAETTGETSKAEAAAHDEVSALSQAAIETTLRDRAN